MEFRMAREEDREQIEWLWSYCFEPKGDPFFEYYFSSVYREEDTLVGLEAGKLQAVVHLRPYYLSVRGKTIPVAYIVGVATHPEARRGGIGKELLASSLHVLRERGHGLSILMPSKAGFYQPYGWDLYCHQQIHRLPLESLRTLTSKSLSYEFVDSVNSWEELDKVYRSYTKGLSGYAVRSEADWKRLLGSILAEGAYIVLAKYGEDPVGYAFYRLGAPEIMVSELLYTTREAQKALLGYLYNHRSQGESIRWNEGSRNNGYIFYPDGKSGNELLPFMMSRIVDVKAAVESIPVDPSVIGNVRISVQDPLVEWNHSLFSWHFEGGATKVEDMGECSPTLPSVLNDQLALRKADVTMEVGALSLLLMGRLSATELAFEGKLRGSEEMIALLDRAYPKQNTFINEWY